MSCLPLSANFWLICLTLGRLSLKIQSDGHIFPSAVSQLNETLAAISCLKYRHVPRGRFHKFEDALSKSNEQGSRELRGIQLQGSLMGREKRSSAGPIFSPGVNKAVDLCLNSIKERFGLLMNVPSSSIKHSSHRPANVVQDRLVFNVDS